MNRGRSLKKILLIVIPAAVVVVLAIVLIVVFGVRKVSGLGKGASMGASVDIPEPVVKSAAEVQAHFEALGRVEGSEQARRSRTVQSERQAVAALRERGFTEFDVTSSYDDAGSSTGDAVVSADSEARHPLYKTLFVPEDGTLWVIYDFNGALMAKAYIHPAVSDDDPPVYLSETGTLMCYDSCNNTFYELSPDPETARVVQVPRIDAETLASWTGMEG